MIEQLLPRKSIRNCLNLSELKRLLALTLPACRSDWTGKSHLAFMPFVFSFWGIPLPSFWGTLATWLLISGHLFAFCFICRVTPGWWSSGLVWFVGLVWVHRYLVQTVWANMWIKVPHPTWESFGKMSWNDWSIYSYDPMIRKMAWNY